MDRGHVARVLAAAAGVAAPAAAGARRSLEAALFHSGAVHVFVDGVDEVLPAYRDKTLRILDLLVRDTRAERVWVAARREVIVSLRCLLPCGSTFLLPLSREEQLVYLRSKWSFANQTEDVFEDVANKLLDAYAFTPGIEHSPPDNQLVGHSLLGVPFNLDLVIEANSDDVKSAVENNTTFLPKVANQLQLIQLFVQKLREKYKKRYGPREALSKLSNDSKAGDDVFHQLQQNYAMLIWTSSTSPLHQQTFQELVKKYEEYVDSEKSGILWKREDGRIQFVHFSFVEYFVATWLFDKVTKDKTKTCSAETSDYKLTYLLETAYKIPQSRVMIFLDLMLAEGLPLHKAIIENDRKILTSPSEGLHKDLGGRTALHVAAAYGRCDCVNNLLGAESDLLQCDSLLQWTPLKYASATANLPTAEILLEKGANPKDLVEPLDIMNVLRLDLVQVLHAFLARKKERSTLEDITMFIDSDVSSVVKVSPLTLAASAGSKRVVNLLIKTGANVNSTYPFGNSPLHQSAYEGHKDIAEVLLSAGADVHCRGQNELTALHIASAKGHDDVVRLLLSKDADVFMKDSRNILPIHLAAQNGHRSVVELLLQTAICNAEIQVNSLSQNNYTPLHYAARSGHKEVVEILLENEANICSETERGDKAIHLSALNGYKEVTEVLLRHGADINSPGQSGASPLHMASNEGHVEVVQLLLSEEADVFKTYFRKELPIYLAAQNGHRSVVELLLQTDISNVALQVNSLAENNYTPLHVAAQNGHKEVVEILLENGASICAETEIGDKAIHLSVLNGHKEVTEVLLRHGADINSPGQLEACPLHMASDNGHVEVVELLLSKEADVFMKDSRNLLPIHLAAENGHRSVVQLLLRTATSNAAIQVNYPGKHNYTPLHCSAQNGHTNVVEILLENGASICAETEKGNKAIHLSALMGHKVVTDVLLQNGADINCRGWSKCTPLHFACEMDHEDVVKLLLDAGAAVESCDLFGRTPLFSAAEMGHVNVVKRLLSIRAGVNRTEISGSTPLHAASWFGHSRVVVVLTHKGAHVNATNIKGQSALHLAALRGDKEVVQLLLSRGADAHLVDKEGFAPIQYAISRMHHAVTKILLRESFRRANL